jgi:hypothetical protein
MWNRALWGDQASPIAGMDLLRRADLRVGRENSVEGGRQPGDSFLGPWFWGLASRLTLRGRQCIIRAMKSLAVCQAHPGTKP